MLQFFYPDLKKEERESLLNKPGVYVYLARKVEELAKTVKTSDGQTVNALQMQAMIWVAIIRKVEKNPNYSVTFDQAVNAKVNSIKTKEEELNQISDFFQKASDVVENELKKKIEFIGSKKLKYED
jgi:Ni,Fe-hydrogenase I large subunit